MSVNNGLKKREVEKILYRKIDSDPDLKYYIENDYITKLIDLLIEGCGEVIEENNKRLINEIFKKR